ncbi:MAG: hypothetical protein H0U46_03835 [Actinobacteria bacterium]|nr:hypothetical protein [Actinomycetota bacterium]
MARPRAAARKTEGGESDFRIFMESPDGRTNRTIELRAKSKDAARRMAERQADDIAEQYGEDAYSVKSIEAI